MKHQNSIITLREYLDKDKAFVIPDYQRGYVWGKSRKSINPEENDSVSYMMESLKEGYEADKQIFVQGVTVTEGKDRIEVIDGQQRTTFFYILLHCLGYQGKFQLKYEVRSNSDDFLSTIDDILKSKSYQEDASEEYQDIYYFKKTIRIIEESLDTFDQNRKDNFREYILSHIAFLYINIEDKSKAVTVFRMMNGSKAEMHHEDVLKAEMLRLVSLDDDDSNDAIQREQDMLRSRYAREWDKWLYWWRRDEVRSFYQSDGYPHPLYLLLYTCFNTGRKKQESFNFENFRSAYLRSTSDAKNTFYQLRHLQKKFEDVFNDVSGKLCLHNTIGGILSVLGNAKLRFIVDYFSGKINDSEIDQFFKLFMMGTWNLGYEDALKWVRDSNHTDKSINEAKKSDEELFKEIICDDDLYYNDDKRYKECAFRQVLLLNLLKDSDLNRAFNFNAYKLRSLEHVHPKSKVYRVDGNGTKVSCETGKPLSAQELLEVAQGDIWFDKADMEKEGCSQHCIGNFALLYAPNNSVFGSKPFEKKKSILFDFGNTEMDKNGDAGVDVFRSRELLHTMSVFAHKTWTIHDIAENKSNIIKTLESYYGIG